ncbi:MAG: tetratricopeptide repeat protein [bacterium]|jgi:tetratricopeptide (TPR) repeat protein
MRAFTQWLALAPLFVIAGCSTLQQTSRLTSSGSALSLSVADTNLGEALAHYSQGLITEASQGTSQSAFLHFRQAAVLDPDHIPINLKVAADLIGRKDYTGAVVVLKSLQLSHPESSEIRLLLGSVYQVQGNQDEAVHQFRSVVRMAPERPEGYLRWAALLAVEFDARRSLAVVRDGFRHVSNPQPLLEFCESAGRLFVAGKDIPSAILFFEQVPDNPQVSYWLGEAYELQGKREKALKSYTLAGKGDPFKVPVALRKANLYMQTEQFAEALTQLDQVERRVSQDPACTNQIPAIFDFWYGITCERVGRIEDSEKYLGRFLAVHPDSGEALNYLAYMWAEQGVNLVQAESNITKALAQEPENGAYLDTLGWIQFKRGDTIKALSSLEKALRLVGKDPTILAHLRAVRAVLKKR